MKRILALTAVVAIGVTATAASALAVRGGKHPIPDSVRRVELSVRKGSPSHVVQRGSVQGKVAHRIVVDLNHMKPYPRHTIFDCVISKPPYRQQIATVRSGGHVWTATVGTCGSLVFRSYDGGQDRGYHSSKAFNADFNYGFGVLRPLAEDVPTSVHRARLTYRKYPTKPVSKRRIVTGEKADALVAAFNHLKVEPPNYVVCDVSGGPIQTVTFATADHRWVITQSPCSEVNVTRDGKTLPTLISDQRWTDAVQAGLGD